MKRPFSLLLFAFPVLLTTSLLNQQQPSVAAIQTYKRDNAISCGIGLYSDTPDTLANGKYITALPGWGRYTYRISTKKDSAQFYFDQGLNMYFSYHMREANASFREAERIDPSCSMAAWGQALSMGPHYNFAASYKMKATVLQVLQRMNRSSAGLTAKEKAMIAVMNLRYSSDTTDSQRPALNAAYADGMKKAILQFPDDPDSKMLYIDAMMLMHPWNFWNNDGSPMPWTSALVSMCRDVLRKYPGHPAALHYYIHLTEASRHPEVALAAANTLKDLLPGVAHMVHMSSHEYERNGWFADGVRVNDSADKDIINYSSLAPGLLSAKPVLHYLAVQTYCALSGGMYEVAIRNALRCRAASSPSYEATDEQDLYMIPQFVRVRMGKWQEILQDTARLDNSWPDAQAMNHFARGMALVYTKQTDKADEELALLKTSATDTILNIREVPFNKPSQRVRIAEHILSATILFDRQQRQESVEELKIAVGLEDSLIYSEPKDWMLPARQYLGAYLLQMGKAAEARKVYQEDLIWNPGNGWSLVGLYQCSKAMHQSRSAARYKAQYSNAFSSADQIPPASVYAW